MAPETAKRDLERTSAATNRDKDEEREPLLASLQIAKEDVLTKEEKDPIRNQRREGRDLEKARLRYTQLCKDIEEDTRHVPSKEHFIH